jgi:DNA ligase-1
MPTTIMTPIPVSPKFKPMLAAAVDDIEELVYPLIATPKIDGIRCFTLPSDNYSCRPVTRSLKDIPNRHIRQAISKSLPPGLDGELIIAGAAFHKSASGIMSFDGQPDFQFHIFDRLENLIDERWHRGVLTKYELRLESIHAVSLPTFCHIVEHTVVRDPKELQDYEERCIAMGHEGVCLRAPHSPYKFGRSSMKEHWLLKMKRFSDGEAMVIGYEELMRNHNAPEINALGYQERSTHSAGMEASGVLGALVVRDIVTEQEFKVGSGFNAADRAKLWIERDQLKGRILTYKHQPHGAKDLPRTPIFKAWRGMRVATLL